MSTLKLKNKCYYLLINQDDNIDFKTTKQFIETLSTLLVARPKLVLLMTEGFQNKNLFHDDSIVFPWMVLTNYHKVSITCPGCATTHHGLWSSNLSNRGIGSFTKNLKQPLCCDRLNGQKIRISYNNNFQFWTMENNNSRINTAKYEGYLMDSFIEKYKLEPEFLHANQKWGSYDKTTNLWNGGVGNVSRYR